MLGDKNLDSEEYNEFLISLIEKAFDKLYGSDKMNNSNEADKLWNILLTNSTLEHNNKNNKQKDKIISAKYYTRNKIMMGCSVKLKDNNMEQEVFFNNRHTGILAGHAYSILDVFEISKPRGKKERKVDILE